MIDASNGISLFRRWLVILGLVLGFLVYDEKSGLVFWLAVFGGLVMVWSIVGAILLGVLRADVTRLRMIFLASIVVFLSPLLWFIISPLTDAIIPWLSIPCALILSAVYFIASETPECRVSPTGSRLLLAYRVALLLDLLPVMGGLGVIGLLIGAGLFMGGGSALLLIILVGCFLAIAGLLLWVFRRSWSATGRVAQVPFLLSIPALFAVYMYVFLTTHTYQFLMLTTLGGGMVFGFLACLFLLDPTGTSLFARNTDKPVIGGKQ